MSRIAIIAAMEREVAPLVRRWHRTTIADGSRNFAAFENAERVAVISGIGRKNAEQAARAAMAAYKAEELISAGLAGALIRSLKIGTVVTPNVIVDAEGGAEYRRASGGGSLGGGILVTANAITGPEAKQQMGQRFHALVVDMEAAGVARVAQELNIGFFCVKAISDETDFVMPPLAQFVDAAGAFRTGRFAVWAVLRPWRWMKIAALGRNSARATDALCRWLEKNLAAQPRSAEVVTLNRAELSEARMK